MLASFSIYNLGLLLSLAVSAQCGSFQRSSPLGHRHSNHIHHVRSAEQRLEDRCETAEPRAQPHVPRKSSAWKRSPRKSCSPRSQHPTAPPNATRYAMIDRWAGYSFFDDGWDFFTESDPTHGMVEYVAKDVAWQKNLISVYSGTPTISVDTSTDLAYDQPRQSVRITSQKQYDGGLFVFDVASMPYGDAVWPAIWTVGVDSWPRDGEIDIVEGVNNNIQNQYTLHTPHGCTTDMSNLVEGFRVDAITSKISNPICGVDATSNAGCAFIDSSKKSYGAPLNAAGGAVFVMLWNESGIKIWSFPRDSIPQDISSLKPDPSAWDARFLKAAWSSSTCDVKKFFRKHAIVINTTLCGDWAGNVFPGGIAACNAVVMKGSNFKNAVWKINSVTVYQAPLKS